MGILGSPLSPIPIPPDRAALKAKKAVQQAPPELPPPPDEWVRELYDDLRVFGGECGQNCPDHPTTAETCSTSSTTSSELQASARTTGSGQASAQM